MMFQNDKELAGAPARVHPCLAGWRKRLDKIQARGYATDQEKEDAAGWDYCAVGEARVRYGLPGPAKGTVGDKELTELGASFGGIVSSIEDFNCKRQVARARETLTAIENRLAEMGY